MIIFEVTEVQEGGTHKIIGYFAVDNKETLPCNIVSVATIKEYDPGLHRFDPYPPEEKNPFILRPAAEAKKSFSIKKLDRKEGMMLETQHQESFGGQIPSGSWLD